MIQYNAIEGLCFCKSLTFSLKKWQLLAVMLKICSQLSNGFSKQRFDCFYLYPETMGNQCIIDP